MKLSKAKMVWLGVLGVAVAVLLVDRLVLSSDEAAPKAATAGTAGGPAASAAKPATAAPAATAPAATTPAAPAAPTAPVRLADRLKALAEAPDLDPMHARDAFAPPESWLVLPKPAEAPAVAVAPADDLAEKFAREHKLTSVLLTGSGGIAIVNGKVLRVGQEVDRFRLLRLEPGCAVFHGCDDDIDVKLKAQADPR